MMFLLLPRNRRPPSSVANYWSRRPSCISSLRLNATLSRPYTFHIGVSWAAKPPDPQVRRLNASFPPDSLVGKFRDEMLASRNATASKDAGEDFFFIAPMRNGSGLALGVADGVGGWVDSGVDPSLFSQALMYHAHRYSRDSWAGEPEIDPTQDYDIPQRVDGCELTPYQCLKLAYSGILGEKHVQAGSSTACLISLNASSGVLRAANLGDSGFLIIRSSAVLYKQPAQTHFFNCPLQLTKFPENHQSDRYYIDPPSAAVQYETKLRDGDIVVAYTDGLSDNVFPQDLLAICALVARSEGSENVQVQSMADKIVQYARTCMRDRRKTSPFQREAAREGVFHRGGKVDDITVILALVRETL
ncbi:phosphatase 2C-like domain-containing protein [Phlebopus sp. FC_14]|nr:phosphatase 2C-like domain-containing protein [Phlebopus sp. FC_14]